MVEALQMEPHKVRDFREVTTQSLGGRRMKSLNLNPKP